MSDVKKYYYLKIKEDFFESDEIKLLQSMPDGYLFSDILMKLYLKSLQSGGKLMFKDRIPYSPNMIATITNHQVSVVEKALHTFRELGLIEILDNGAIFMLDIENFIGQSSNEAERKKAYRQRIKEEKSKLLPNGDTTTNLVDKCPDNIPKQEDTFTEILDEIPPEIRDRDKSIDIRDKDIKNKDIAQVSKVDKKKKEIKHKHGEYGHVLLTDQDYTKLVTEHGDILTKQCITFLDEYIEMKGYKAKSHYLCIRRWVLDAVEQSKKKSDKQPQKFGNKSNQFGNYEQRKYDFKDLEKKLLGW